MTNALRRGLHLDRMVAGAMAGWVDTEPEGHPRGPQPSASPKTRRMGRPPLLTDEQQDAVRASDEPVAVLMKRHNVSRSTITRTRRVKTPAPTSEI